MASREKRDQVKPSRRTRTVRVDSWKLGVSEPAPAATVQKWLIDYRVGGDLAARDQLLQTHMRLIAHWANRFARDRVVFDDLMSEGVVAFLRAVENFDTGRGVPFSAYATAALQKKLRGIASAGFGATQEFELLGDEPPAETVSALGRMADRDSVAAVLRGLDAIPATSARTLCKRFGIRGERPHDFAHLGEALSKPVRDLPAIVQRAMDQLRAALTSGAEPGAAA